MLARLQGSARRISPVSQRHADGGVAVGVLTNRTTCGRDPAPLCGDMRGRAKRQAHICVPVKHLGVKRGGRLGCDNQHYHKLERKGEFTLDKRALRSDAGRGCAFIPLVLDAHSAAMCANAPLCNAKRFATE